MNLDLSGMVAELADEFGTGLETALKPILERMESLNADNGDGLISLEQLSVLLSVSKPTLRESLKGNNGIPDFSVQVNAQTTRYRRAAYVRWLRGEVVE